ncbi:MAG: zinc ribbon domain-containing protein [Clostridiales bacterium]|nr:zinc ribbon domain-containing protein [Clostridiales bacterium]
MKKVCPACGRLGLEGSDFCGECGNRLVEAPASPVPAAVPQVSAQTGVPQTNTVLNKRDARVISTEEKSGFSLKNGYISHMVTAGELIKDDALITEKRLYYNQTQWTLFSKKTVETRLDVEDISATTLVHNNPWNFVALAVLSLIVFVIDIILAQNKVWDDLPSIASVSIMFTPLILMVVFLVLWLYFRQSYFKVEYASGNGKGNDSSGVLVIPVRFYGIERIREFQKQIYLAKDAVRK